MNVVLERDFFSTGTAVLILLLCAKNKSHLSATNGNTGLIELAMLKIKVSFSVY